MPVAHEHPHEYRLLVLLAISAGLHALVLAWVQGPARQPAALTALTATLRFSADSLASAAEVASQLPPALVSRQPRVAAPARPEVRQLPAPREPKMLPAALATAGPTNEAATGTATRPAAPVDSLEAVAVARPSAADAARLLNGYGQRLSELFSRQQQYPRLAAQRGWEGEVRLRLSVARQGTLAAVRLESSSGFAVLDRHALAMIEQLQQLPAPPAELEMNEVQVVVPVHYKLRKPA
jgi:protein TonB